MSDESRMYDDVVEVIDIDIDRGIERPLPFDQPINEKIQPAYPVQQPETQEYNDGNLSQNIKKLKDHILGKEPDPIPSKSKKEAIRKWNNSPQAKANGVIAVNKKLYYAILIMGITALILFFWTNISIANDKLKADVDVTNNVDIPDTTINFQNNNSNEHVINNNINITVQLPAELVIQHKNLTL